jgi:hypothetical protein
VANELDLILRDNDEAQVSGVNQSTDELATGTVGCGCPKIPARLERVNAAPNTEVSDRRELPKP